MNKASFLLLAAGLLAAAVSGAQSKLSGPYTLKIDVSSLQEKPGRLYFRYYNIAAKKTVTDSAEITGSSTAIAFKGNIDEPMMGTLSFMPKSPEGKPVVVRSKYSFNFYFDPGTVTVLVHDSLSAATVSGSPSHTVYEKLAKNKAEQEERQSELLAGYSGYAKAKDSVNMKATMMKVAELRKDIREKVYKPFVLEYANSSPVSLMALSAYAGYAKSDEVELLFNKLSPEYKDLPSAKVILEKIEIAKNTSVGAMAPDFTQADTLGIPVSLSSFRGKYVLLDFWASWCVPCRAENPNVVKTFNHYRDKGFTVLSVSLDKPEQKDKWLKAIHDDKLTWTHVSDLRFWNNAVARQYDITAVPQSFLIGPDGKILARNLRGDALAKKMAELLGPPEQGN